MFCIQLVSLGSFITSEKCKQDSTSHRTEMNKMRGKKQQTSAMKKQNKKQQTLNTEEEQKRKKKTKT